jgi:hypothetical protein
MRAFHFLRGRVRARLLTVALTAGLVLVARSAGAEDEAPRLLRAAPLPAPVEMMAIGLAPEVQVSIQVDARGRVSGTTVLSVAPSTEFDPLVRAAVAKSLLDWRFAPARKDGMPTEATIQWRLQLGAAATETSAHAVWDPIATALADPRQRQGEISDLPLDERLRLLNRYAAIAEKHLQRAARKRFDSPRFIVVTDAGTPETAEVLAGNLEAVFNILHGVFDEHVEPQPMAYKLIAYLFATEEAFIAARGEIGVAMPAAGFYASPGFFAFHGGAPTAEALLGIMLHETFHAYSDRHLHRPGVLLPLWAEEGLAEYFGNSRIEGKRLLPGKTLRGSFVATHYGGAYYVASQSRLSADNLRRALRSGDAPSLGEVMRASFPVFYGERRELYYSLSWLLVHFLRHGEEGWAETLFPDLMLYLVEGYDPEASLRAVYGVDEAEMAERFRAYVRKL